MRADLIASIRPAGTAPSSAKMIIRGPLGDAGTSTGAIRSSPPVLIVCETKPVVFKSPQENMNSKIAAMMKVAQQARRVTFIPPIVYSRCDAPPTGHLGRGLIPNHKVESVDF